MKDIAIHNIHRRLAEAAYMHMNHETGRIKVEEIPLKHLESLLMQNYLIVRQLDELRELSMVAYMSGDSEWVSRICEAIELISDQFNKIQEGEWK